MSSRTATHLVGLSETYEKKASSYFSNARSDFVKLLPRDPSASILELGCGTGATGALALARGRAGRYVGIELTEQAGRKAREVLTEVLIGDVERMELNWYPATFDALILSEVLEHLVEPGKTLERLGRFVRPGGMVLASSPNIAYWRVIKEFAFGRFPLTDSGTFDRTHLRWFTPDSFARMFQEADFVVDHIGPVTPFSQRVEIISWLAAGRLDHLFISQICLQGHKR